MNYQYYGLEANLHEEGITVLRFRTVLAIWETSGLHLGSGGGSVSQQQSRELASLSKGERVGLRKRSPNAGYTIEYGARPLLHTSPMIAAVRLAQKLTPRCRSFILIIKHKIIIFL